MPRTLREEPAFLAYSITKTFTAALALLLQEEGRVDLDARLARWFPRVASSDWITLRRLLNHTAGLADYGGLPAYQEAVRSSPKTPWPFERFAAETMAQGLVFEPGAGWAYSNPGYMLVKRILEEIAGSSYAALVADRVSKPLGLPRTFVAESPNDLASLASAASRALSNDGRWLDVRETYHPGWVSHGVVASTPSDIVRFYAALFGERLVARRSLAQMTAFVAVPVARPGWRRPSYGLGLMGDPQSPWGALSGHGGEGPGYVSSAFHLQASSGAAVIVCAMCALEAGATAEALAFDALDAVRPR